MWLEELILLDWLMAVVLTILGLLTVSQAFIQEYNMRDLLSIIPQFRFINMIVLF